MKSLSLSIGINLEVQNQLKVETKIVFLKK
jgi:hypothetical protein